MEVVKLAHGGETRRHAGMRWQPELAAFPTQDNVTIVSERKDRVMPLLFNDFMESSIRLGLTMEG